jgi:SsrA-binding protein
MAPAVPSSDQASSTSLIDAGVDAGSAVNCALADRHPGGPLAMAADTITNRKALRDYHILERFEAGIELRGTEIKSIRSGLANLNDAYARVEDGQAFLYGANIQPYVRASHEQHDPVRRRRLLLHREEIDRMFSASAVEGHTLVALRLYWKKQLLKIEIGVGKGKVAHDKRQDIKKRVENREAARAVAGFNRQRSR